ncbi:MAG: ABC transporter ATP-binding protein [Candidatus Kapabacteria bacterium]|nr:ABC transporter ATP-binding protein [Candidatus Kapabacteria bacterium]
MQQNSLSVKNLGKIFGKGFKVFDKVNFDLNGGEALAITGSNGSGKSTMLKIIAGVVSPTKGEINCTISGVKIDYDNISEKIGFVSPYLILYEEFTPIEHFQVFAKIRGIHFSEEKAVNLLKHFNIYKRRNDPIRTFSSGMKQRIKYINALIADPAILMLDEPSTNLDIQGIDAVDSLIESHLTNNSIVLIASNDEREIRFCKQRIELTN